MLPGLKKIYYVLMHLTPGPNIYIIIYVLTYITWGSNNYTSIYSKRLTRLIMSLDICKSIYISTGDYLLNSTENMFTELCVYIAQT